MSFQIKQVAGAFFSKNKEKNNQPRALNATIFSLAAAGEIFSKPRSAMTLLSVSPTTLLVISAEMARVCMSVGTATCCLATESFVPGDTVRVECRVGGISSLRRLAGRLRP